MQCPKCETTLSLGFGRFRVDDWKTVVGPIDWCPCGFQQPTEATFTCDHDLHEDPDLDVSAWLDWAQWKQATHAQVPCPECGRWKVWVPRMDGV